MALKQDDIQIEITEDGTIKVTTDPVSGANHANAEQFLRDMAAKAGGQTSRRRKGHGHAHEETGTHVHLGGGHTHEH